MAVSGLRSSKYCLVERLLVCFAYFRYATSAHHKPNENKEMTNTSPDGVQAPSSLVVEEPMPNENQLVEHAEDYLSSWTTHVDAMVGETDVPLSLD